MKKIFSGYVVQIFHQDYFGGQYPCGTMGFGSVSKKDAMKMFSKIMDDLEKNKKNGWKVK